MKVLNVWCERIPDFFIQRIGGVMIRLAFNVLETIPAEYVTTARIQVDRLVNMVLTKGYGVLDEELWCAGVSKGNGVSSEYGGDDMSKEYSGNDMSKEYNGITMSIESTDESKEHSTVYTNSHNTHTHEPSPPSPSLTRRIQHIDIDEDMFLDESFTSFYQREVARRDARLQDILGVIVNKLLLFYGPASQLAASLVDRIASFPREDAVLTMLHATLHEHKEFEQCAKLVPQQQMRWE